MANVDLSGYNLNELKNMRADIEKAIKDRQYQEVQKAREQILAIAKDAGLSVEEVFATSKKVKKTTGQKAQPKYQNPKDISQTWTGRGRKPKWITGALAGGKKLDDFRMK